MFEWKQVKDVKPNSWRCRLCQQVSTIRYWSSQKSIYCHLRLTSKCYDKINKCSCITYAAKKNLESFHSSQAKWTVAALNRSRFTSSKSDNKDFVFSIMLNILTFSNYLRNCAKKLSWFQKKLHATVSYFPQPLKRQRQKPGLLVLLDWGVTFFTLCSEKGLTRSIWQSKTKRDNHSNTIYCSHWEQKKVV